MGMWVMWMAWLAEVFGGWLCLNTSGLHSATALLRRLSKTAERLEDRKNRKTSHSQQDLSGPVYTPTFATRIEKPMSYLKQKKDLPLGGFNPVTGSSFWGSPRKRRRTCSQLAALAALLFVIAWCAGYFEGGLASVNG